MAASLIGSSIEWYDFFLYGAVTPLVLAKRFFPSEDPKVALLQAYATFALPFFVRPLGGIVFSHLGDRMGRKISLVLTLTLMGSATVLIGCVPDYPTIGLAAPALLILLRCVQGLGLGGEWGGALLLAIEYSPDRRRALFGSIPQMGVTIGLLLGTFAISIVSLLPEEQFLSWGWRLPFIASIALVWVGLWIRKGIDETPAFKEAQARGEISRVPLLDTLRFHRRAVLLAIGLKVVETAPFYIFSTFIISFAVDHGGFTRVQALNAVIIGSIVATGVIPLGGLLADRIGRVPVYLAGALGIAVFAYPYFYLLSLRSPTLLIMATVIGLGLCHGSVTSVLGTLYSELFATKIRFTGVTLGYQMGAAIAGGTAPFIATWLLSMFENSTAPISLYLIAVSTISVSCILVIQNDRRKGETAP